MIRIDFLMPREGKLVGFHISGHGGWGEEGADIVCAAVSSAAYMAANTITEVLKVEPLALKVSDGGEMLLRLKEEDEPVCRAVLQGLNVHFTGLEGEYPAHISVKYLKA